MITKASRITNLTDARYFAAKEVDFLGFNLEPGTEGFLDPVYMKAIKEWVQGPKIVGEFSSTPAAQVREAATFYGLDAVQITRQQLEDIALPENIPVILCLEAGADPEKNGTTLDAAAGRFQHALLDFSTLPHAWQSIKAHIGAWQELARRFSLLLHLDIEAADFPELRALLPEVGFNFAGGEEEKVGVKSYDEMDEIFDCLES